MRNNKEYTVCKQLAEYLRWQYKEVIYHFDQAGLAISKAQAGMMKAIQHGRGFPDLMILHPGKENKYHGFFLELKADGERLLKKDGTFASEHIKEQYKYMEKLHKAGYKCMFAVGFDEAKKLIDEYLK
jgi:hypothetical protein